MPPKSPQEQPADQGQLFPVYTARTHPAVMGEVVEGGIFPEDLPLIEDAQVQHFHETVHEQVVAEQKTRNRHLGNAGKHSVLARDGNYASPRIGDFLPGFGPVMDRNYEDAVAHAHELERQRVARLGQQPVLAAFAEQAFRMPADVQPDAAAERVKPTIDYQEANTQIKLEALRDDERAGFLPKTHREKSQAYKLLSYMEPGKYERGVSTRLDEIFYHQQKEADKAGKTPLEGYDIANDSVRSVIREWGDYYTNARSSWRKLHALHKLVDDTPSPRLNLGELLDDEARGEVVTQLIRYDILRQRRDTDKPLGFDPLWVREDRSAPTDEKHKTVEDVFTHQQEQFMAAYVRRRAESLTVGQVRRLIVEAKRDEALRSKFWRGALESLHEDYQSYAEAALQQARLA